MTTFLKQQIRRGKHEYKIEIALDHDALLENQLRTSVTGAVRRIGDEEWDEVTYDIEVDFKTEMLLVKYGGETVATVPLGLSLADSIEPGGEDIDVEADDDVISGALETIGGTDLAEHILQALPVPDPFLGCLLKSAISTTVGQIVRCWNAQQTKRPLKYVVRQMAECLGAHKWGMVATFLVRSGRCMVFCGLS